MAQKLVILPVNNAQDTGSNAQINLKRGHLDGRSEMLSFVGTLWIQMLVFSCTNFFQIA